jgi:hypothetical protein
MDKYLPWERLTLIQQMYYVCNTLKKAALTNAIINRYHQQPTQFLPKEDAVLVVWGDKMTGNISHTIQFHASKEMARRYLQTWRVQPWTSKRFDKVNWEHLDSALQTKSDMYKIWLLKQTSGFCGARVQVGRYTGQDFPDKHCPNCDCQKTAVHPMQCPDENRTRLLIESTDKLAKWLETDKKTDPELAYWIPKYIFMRGDKPFAELGAMSPK